MHVMFVNPGFPAQFGSLAQNLSTRPGWRVTYVTAANLRHLQLPFAHITYPVPPAGLPQGCPNHGNLHVLFEHMQAVYRTLQAMPQVRPDVIIGHAFYGTLLYLKNLYPDCPCVAYFDWMPPAFWSKEFAFRPEFPPPEAARLLHATLHTFKNLQLLAADAAYTPTPYQRSTAPVELQSKLRVIFDGMDVDLFRRRELPRPFVFHGVPIGPRTRVVTYASPGLESVRGFDIFMQMAQRVAAANPDVLFLIAGEEKSNYGHETYHLGGRSFKAHVLSQCQFNLERFHFLGKLSIEDLITLYSLSDLHVYLTAPFVLSWSLVQSMTAECVILGSDTAPVRDAIDHGVQGLLAGFHDVDGLTAQALAVLHDPARFRHLGAAARSRVIERYETSRCGDQMASFLREVAASTSATATPAMHGESSAAP